MKSDTGYLEWLLEIALLVLRETPALTLCTVAALGIGGVLLWRQSASMARHKRLATGAVLGLFLILPAACSYWTWYSIAGPGRYAELEFVSSALEEIPGVEVIETGGHEDLSFENIWAKVQVSGRGTVTFRNLDYDSFQEGDSLVLDSIGSFEMIVEGEGEVGVYRQDTGAAVRSRFAAGSIDIAPGKAFARFFPFECRKVLDVIVQYDEICEVLGSWPLQPAYSHFRDEQGTDYYYCRKNPSLDLDWINPVELR